MSRLLQKRASFFCGNIHKIDLESISLKNIVKMKIGLTTHERKIYSLPFSVNRNALPAKADIEKPANKKLNPFLSGMANGK
jgi:hypothetical protein